MCVDLSGIAIRVTMPLKTCIPHQPRNNCAIVCLQGRWINCCLPINNFDCCIHFETLSRQPTQNKHKISLPIVPIHNHTHLRCGKQQANKLWHLHLHVICILLHLFKRWLTTMSAAKTRMKRQWTKVVVVHQFILHFWLTCSSCNLTTNIPTQLIVECKNSNKSSNSNAQYLSFYCVQ